MAKHTTVCFCCSFLCFDYSRYEKRLFLSMCLSLFTVLIFFFCVEHTSTSSFLTNWNNKFFCYKQIHHISNNIQIHIIYKRGSCCLNRSLLYSSLISYKNTFPAINYSKILQAITEWNYRKNCNNTKIHEFISTLRYL